MKDRSEIAILFVDDELDILSSLNRFLRREPYMKMFAENGQKALELLESNDISIVVSDLRMPEMNGLELISEVKKRKPEVLRLILSGSQDFDQIINSINKGEVFRFVPKPVDPEAFKQVLNDAIDYYCLKTEREELFDEISRKNSELLKVNEALSLMAQDLRRSEEKFRSMTDAAQDAVFMINPDGRIIYRNNAAESIFGYNRNEYDDQRLIDIISSGFREVDVFDICKSMLENTSGNGESLIWQINGLRKNGTIVPLEISRGSVFIDSVRHTVLIARDITARVEAEESRMRYENMQKELESEIERKLLQGLVPLTFQGASISRLMMPSGHLDGDFTEFVVYNDCQVDILIGDVMGHGIHSALIGAGIKTLFVKVLAQKKYSQNDLPLLQDIVAGVHELCITELMELGSFVTMLFMRLDLESGSLAMVDCGHPPVIHFHAATRCCSLLKGEQMPMGMIREQDYSVHAYPVFENDILVLYSDGITESCSPDHTMFGEERLVELIEKHHEKPPHLMIEEIKAALSGFARREAFDDDVTCIVIRIGNSGFSIG
ncbi:MAG: response regulator [Chlorobium sp.]|nr:MAG: response regulator [Chlorobium sp.]